MLEYVQNNSEFEYKDDVIKKYPDCKVLLTDVDISDIEHIRGIVYAISRSADSFDEICELSDEMGKKRLTMIVGSYNNYYGGMGLGFWMSNCKISYFDSES